MESGSRQKPGGDVRNDLGTETLPRVSGPGSEENVPYLPVGTQSVDPYVTPSQYAGLAGQGMDIDVPGDPYPGDDLRPPSHGLRYIDHRVEESVLVQCGISRNPRDRRVHEFLGLLLTQQLLASDPLSEIRAPVRSSGKRRDERSPWFINMRFLHLKGSIGRYGYRKTPAVSLTRLTRTAC